MTIAGKRVLVVEDDAALLMIMRFNLTDMGYCVQAVPNGCEAWEYAQQQQFDLVITDYHVQGITGADLCRRLRAEPRYAEIPIILSTGRKRDLALENLKDELGLAAVITKPFEVETLKNTVAGCLSDCATA